MGNKDTYVRANGKKRGYVRTGATSTAANTYASNPAARRQVNSAVNEAWEREEGADDN